jgi:hypothetical protein
MRIRSAALISALAATVLTIGIASAQKAVEAPVPKGHEAFFKGLKALAKKYPESAARFSIVDGQGKAVSQPQPKSHGSCCQWKLRPFECVRPCEQ